MKKELQHCDLNVYFFLFEVTLICQNTRNHFLKDTKTQKDTVEPRMKKLKDYTSN